MPVTTKILRVLTTAVGSVLMVLVTVLLLAACTSTPLSEARASTPVASPNQATPTSGNSATPTPSHTPELPATNTSTPSQTPAPTRTATPTATPTQTRVPHLVAIDAGHGGIDLGTRHFDAQGHMDVHESEVNLALALKLRDILVARGYRVFMTRDGDYRVNADEVDLLGDGEVTSADEAQARVDLINASRAELLLSIHQNAYWPDGVPDQSVGGPVTFYCADRPFAAESLRFAQLVQYHIVGAIRSLGYDSNDRGVEDDLAIQQPGSLGTHLILLGPVSERIVRASEMPGALTETLFLSNDREAQLLMDPDAQQVMAMGYADAIDAYFAGASAPVSED